jgi:hypothetical protein
MICGAAHCHSSIWSIEWVWTGVDRRPCCWPSIWILDEEQLRESGEEVHKVGTANERFVCVTSDYSWISGLPQKDAYPPMFWRSLLDDWAKVFREPMRARPAIGNFYEEYGPVTRFGTVNNYESLEAASLSIEWLGTLARVVQWLKDERYGPLWDWS